MDALAGIQMAPGTIYCVVVFLLRGMAGLAVRAVGQCQAGFGEA